MSNKKLLIPETHGVLHIRKAKGEAGSTPPPKVNRVPSTVNRVSSTYVPSEYKRLARDYVIRTYCTFP